MKANEPPVEIYLTTDGNNSFVFTRKRSDNKGIEYVRTDVFIKKAEKYLKNQFIKDVSVLAGGVVSINFSAAIKNFVKYMKGE